MKRLDIEGKKFGKWTAISYAGERGWNCVCECGTAKVVQTGNLTNGASTQCRKCGPLISTTNHLHTGEAACNEVISSYTKGARVRSIEWALTREQAKDLFSGLCFYCGTEPTNVFFRKILNGKFIYNGIDRVDSSLGYTIDNCVSCCTTCNYMKRSLSLDNFTKHVKRIASHLEAL